MPSAMDRIESPAAIPREISSRSSKRKRELRALLTGGRNSTSQPQNAKDRSAVLL